MVGTHEAACLPRAFGHQHRAAVGGGADEATDTLAESEHRLWQRVDPERVAAARFDALVAGLSSWVKEAGR